MIFKLTKNDKYLPFKVLFVMLTIQLILNLYLPGQWNNSWNGGIGVNFYEGIKGWEEVVFIHKDVSVFAGRVFTTKLLDLAYIILNIERLVSYIILSTLAYFISGIFLIKSSRKFTDDNLSISITVFIFFASFTNLFYQLNPLYTYDDPFQLMFIILGTYYLLNNNLVLLFIFGFLASYVRETTVFVFTGWIILSWFKHKSFKSSLFVTIALFISGVTYLIANHYTQIAIGVLDANKEYMTSSRNLHFLKGNFRSIVAIGSTLASFLNVFMFPIGILIINRKRVSKSVKQFIVAFIIVFSLNTPTVFLLAKARESRLFTLPMVFIWPVYGEILISWIKNINKRRSYYIPVVIGLIMYAGFFVLFCFEKNLEFSRFILIGSVILFLISNYMYNKYDQNGVEN